MICSLILPTPEHAPLHHLERIGLHVGQKKQPSVFGCRQGAVLVYAKPAHSPRFPIEKPRRHMRVERGLKGRNEKLKLVESDAGAIEELHGADCRSVNRTLAIAGPPFLGGGVCHQS